jgi:hypothetical protein
MNHGRCVSAAASVVMPCALSDCVQSALKTRCIVLGADTGPNVNVILFSRKPSMNSRSVRLVDTSGFA